MLQHSSSLETLVHIALAEDAADHDLTGQFTIPLEQTGTAIIRSKASGILSGTQVTDLVFSTLDSAIKYKWQHRNGDSITCGEILCNISGSLRTLLAAERTALNFLQHLSGIATATQHFVLATADTGCCIVDTRKTTPGLRLLEKQAVVHGGGINHRMNLEDGMLIKENHIAAAGSITQAIQACRRMNTDLWIETECETLDEVREAVAAQPDIILLDNMDVATVAKARMIVPKHITLEASGNITLATVSDYARTGVDRLAVGAITHSAPALDLSMQIMPDG